MQIVKVGDDQQTDVRLKHTVARMVGSIQSRFTKRPNY